MQIPLANTSDVARLNVSEAPGYVALERISPKLRGLRLIIIISSLMFSRGQALRKGSAECSWPQGQSFRHSQTLIGAGIGRG